MLWQVLKDGKVKMFTEDVNCIPTKEIVDKMKKSGYKIKQSNMLDKKIK